MNYIIKNKTQSIRIRELSRVIFLLLCKESIQYLHVMTLHQLDRYKVRKTPLTSKFCSPLHPQFRTRTSAIKGNTTRVCQARSQKINLYDFLLVHQAFRPNPCWLESQGQPISFGRPQLYDYNRNNSLNSLSNSFHTIQL